MLNAELQGFFMNIHRDEDIHFRCMKDRSIKDLKSKYNEDAHTFLSYLNDQDYEIYFVANTGGYRDEHITKINCVFVDLDRGRDQNGEYFDLDTVSEYKKLKLQELCEYEYQPTHIIETRNGLHAYWLLEEGATIDDFNECEMRLINYFSGDRKVRRPANLLRVPNFYWCKYKDNKYMVRILEYNHQRYCIKDLVDSLPDVDEVEKRVNDRKKCFKLLSIDATKTQPTSNNNIDFIKQQNIDVLHAILKPEEISFSNHLDVYDYLKKQGLHEFLGLHGNTFNCIFHKDHNPSAGIVVNEETGHQIYNCLSSSCGISLTIIQVVERLTGLNRVEALRFLRKVYKVGYYESDWQREKKAILEENKLLLLSSELEVVYPEVNSIIKRYTMQLSLLNELAIHNLQTENFTDKLGNPIFYASTRYIAKKCGKGERRLSDVINLFAYLGLIRKVPENEIPSFLLDKARSEAAKKKQKYIVNYYSIPPYGEITFDFCKRKVREYKEYGFTMKAWSRELILRVLGEAEADRVFPQMKGQHTKYAQAMDLVEPLALRLIEQKGWTTEGEIQYELVNENFGTKTYWEKRIKIIVPELIDKYGLIKRRLNKELKEHFNITLAGYPSIIYRQY
ncbi:hypothetical protein [Ammoniphilus sp. 3BR4]|uniref:hypothetical protein n=1 Tax=Ammoniphilus sp. 3BR4 TaxID=3158265 RepID=UPI0034674216